MKKLRACKKNLSAVVFSLNGLLLLLAILLLPPHSAIADCGPKPSMGFAFEFENAPVAILSGQQIDCDDENCLNGKALEELGAQGFSCTENTCSSVGYGYSEYNKLIIEFADRTRESNVFTKKAYSADYTVTVTEDALIVKENFSLTGLFDRNCCSGFLSTLVFETLIASLYFAAFQLPKAVLGFVPIASLITLPLVWFAFPLLPISSTWAIGISEIIAVGLEAVFIYFAAFRRIRFRHILILSLIMNVISFGIGLLIHF